VGRNGQFGRARHGCRTCSPTALCNGFTGSHDAFVIEDADHMLMARTNGNHDLHRFLAIADGVVRAQGRKIIFTTNLPNVRDLDEALLRPGGCFAVMRTRSLVGQEIDRLVARLCEGDPVLQEAARASLTAGGARAASVAQVYRACDLAREQRVRATDRPTESASHLNSLPSGDSLPDSIHKKFPKPAAGGLLTSEALREHYLSEGGSGIQTVCPFYDVKVSPVLVHFPGRDYQIDAVVVRLNPKRAHCTTAS
jgi:hypothetical protein